MAYRANRAKSLREYGCECEGEFGHMSALLSVGLAKWFLQNGLGRNGAALPGVSLSGSLAPC